MKNETDVIWRNWGRNQEALVSTFARPGDEDEAVAAVRDALAAGRRVRVVGGGHSFTPVVATPDLLLDLSDLTGLLSTDPARHRFTAAAGSRIADLGAPLWDAGLAIANQGDIDAQSLAGAIATGTKGSGRRFGSMSSSVVSARLVDGRGDVVDVDDSQPDVLHAAQVSLGLLGPVLRLGVQAVPAYRLREENVVLPIEEVFERWDALEEEYRHFSFWWSPTDASSELYALGPVPADHAFVKLLREVPPEGDDLVGEPNARTGRSHLIYPDGTTEAEFHELEYMVDAKDTQEVVHLMRDLMRTQFPEEISPLQVRLQKGDQGLISPQHGRDSASISVSGKRFTDYVPFLKAVDKALAPYGARPHWGKLHFLTGDRVRELYPRFDDFVAIRRRFDPEGSFLNPHLRELFA